MCKTLSDLQISLLLTIKKKGGEMENINKNHFQLCTEAFATFL